jgi:hypothetical protein
MVCILLSVPLLFLGLCTVAAVMGSSRHDRLMERPVPPSATGETEETNRLKLCA